MRQIGVQQEHRFSRLRNVRGNSTVETAMLMLPFFMVIFAVTEFGWYFLHQHTLQFATREGMRLALVGEVLDDEQGNPLTREQSIIQSIKDKAAWSMAPDDVNVNVQPLALNNYTNESIDWENLAPNAGNPADYVRIRVTYDHHFFTPLIGQLFDSNCTDGCSVTMNAEATYRNELFEV